MDSTTIISDNNTIMNTLTTYQKTGLGERLKLAREALQLTEKEVAIRLHLNIAVISQLENEAFEDGPPKTFMRGYLRSYAKLLNLSEDDIALTLKNLENAAPPSANSISITQMKPQKGNERYLHWLTYVIVLILVILVSVWWNSHSRYAISDVPPAETKPITPAVPAVTTTTSTNEPAHPVTAEPPVATETPAAAVAPMQKTIAPEPQATATNTAATPTTAPDAGTPVTTPAPATTAPNSTAPATPTTGIATPPTPGTTFTPTSTPAASETTTPAAAATTKPAQKSSLSHLKMALPEPDVEE